HCRAHRVSSVQSEMRRAMQNGANGKEAVASRTEEGVTRITVGGFKSIRDEQRIEVRPLTILAGANSSGKSSIMQPLLLLKQTLEAPFDPGPLLLNGPNVKFTSIDQLLWRQAKEFWVGIRLRSSLEYAPFGLRTGRLSHVNLILHFSEQIPRRVQ